MTALIATLIGLGVAGGAAVIAVVSRRNFRKANEIVPGVSTNAPKAWAGAHSPEARLHRRLRDAVAAVHALPGADDGRMADLRRSLEVEALAVDEQLIAAAALAPGVREDPLNRIAEAVAAIEAAVAAMVATPIGSDESQVGGLVSEAIERRRHVAEAHEELRRAEGGL